MSRTLITILSLLCLLAVTLVTSALLAYPVYELLTGEVPFHKVLSRLTVLLGLMFCLIYLALYRSYNRQSLGYAFEPNEWIKYLCKGFLIGAGVVLVLETLLLTLGIHGLENELDLSAYAITKLLLVSALSGFAVAIIEETIFRGAIFSVLLKSGNAVTAIILSSIFYAAVHFIKYPQLAADTEITWLTGLTLLPDVALNLISLPQLDLFLTLFMLGVLLGILRLRFGNIVMCIGLHAGIVMLVKIGNHFTDYVPHSRFDFLVNQQNHQMGYLAFGLLLILATIIYQPYPAKQSPQI